MSNQHSPLPWRHRPCPGGSGWDILPGNTVDSFHGHVVEGCDEYDCGVRSEADAAFIVRACNVHDELLEFVRELVKDVGECYCVDEIKVACAWCRARAAIAKAEGKETQQ